MGAPAWWQSGYAEDCKSLYAGSIPTQASKIKRPERGGLFFVFHLFSAIKNIYILIKKLPAFAGIFICFYSHNFSTSSCI